jgi:hypothetical protein
VVTADGLRDGEKVAERLQMPGEKLREDLAAYAEIGVTFPGPEGGSVEVEVASDILRAPERRAGLH